MHIYAPGSFNGHYCPQGDITTATPDTHAILFHTFGLREDGPGISNEALAAFTDEHFSDYRIIVHRDAAAALETKPALVIGGKSVGYYGGGVKTSGEFESAISFAAAESVTGLIHVAHAFHAPRIRRQANMRRMNSIIPTDLPDIFDPESLQPWIRSREAWCKREWKAQLYVLAMDALKIKLLHKY